MNNLKDDLQYLKDGFGNLMKQSADTKILSMLERLINPTLNVKFTRLHENAVIPKYAKLGDAGLDLVAVDRKYIRTDLNDYYEYDLGLSIEIPEGYVGLIFPRSSISNTDLVLSNAVGVIDSGFRGRLSARFRKLSGSPHVYEPGDRVCQLIVLPYPRITITEVPYEELSKTERGAGGFGSSGR